MQLDLVAQDSPQTFTEVRVHVVAEALVEAHVAVEVTTEHSALDALTPLLCASVQSGVR